jgi:hypothetical protein
MKLLTVMGLFLDLVGVVILGMGEVMKGAASLRSLKQYFGQNLGCLIGNDPIVTKCFVIRAGFLQTLPVG